jgi:hypothetical protein
MYEIRRGGENLETPSFNPGQFVAFYMSWLPDESTKEGVDGGFMFPRPRKVSSKFKIHDPQEMKLFEPNMKGIEWALGSNPVLISTHFDFSW